MKPRAALSTRARARFTALTAALAALLTALLASSTAHAGRCRRPFSAPRFPLALSLSPGDFATTPAACSFSSVMIDVRAAAQIRTAEYYGTLGGEAALLVNAAVDDNIWFSGSYSLARFTFVQNASLIATQVDTGPATVAMHGVVARGDRWQLAPFLRLLLPLETGSRYSLTMGVEPGASFLWVAANRFSLTGGLSLPTSFAITDSRSRTVFAPRLSVDAAWTPWSWAELVVSAEARLVVTSVPGLDDSAEAQRARAAQGGGVLDYFAPKIALRFFPWRGPVVQLAVMFPLAGLERTLLRAGLMVGGTF